MISAELIAHFHLLGDAPETVQQLRKVIVALAIRGKLANDGKPAIEASSLRDEIRKRRHALTVTGELHRKEQPEVVAEDLPADFLDTSRFVRLGFVANVEKGVTGIQSAKQGPYPLVVTAADRATCDHFDFEGAAAIVPLVSSAGHGKASLNRLHYQEGKFALGSILAAVFPLAPELISARFLFEYLTAFKEELLVSRMSGTANVTLTVGRLCDVPVPLIAPATQKRIDELMALCDQLEAARNEREARRDRLVAASLHRIGTALTALEEAATGAPSAARFHLDHLPRLTTRLEHIKQLRQTILNLAVRGRLVPQDPSDESAIELLERIQAAKASRDIKVRSKPRKSEEKKIQEEHEPTLPQGWVWATLADLTAVLNGRAYSKNELLDEGTPVLRVGNLFTSDHWYYSNLTLEDDKYCDQGDLIFSWSASFGPFIWPGPKVIYHYHIWKLSLHSEVDLNKHYLYKFLLQKTQEIKDSGHGVSMIHMTKEKMEKVLVPLPPLAEQNRIVAKVDELMALCDQLEAQLAATQSDSRRLLEAVLHEALAA